MSIFYEIQTEDEHAYAHRMTKQLNDTIYILLIGFVKLGVDQFMKK